MRNETELPLDYDEEETIEVTKETYNPKDFEDEEEEFRTDWMKPETSSSDDFIDDTEFADMPSNKQEDLDEFENMDVEKQNEDEELELNSLNDADLDEVVRLN